MNIFGVNKGRRREGLERMLAVLQARAMIARTRAWVKVLKPYIENQKAAAAEAWHKMEIDRLTDSQLVRNEIAQRATVKSMQNIIDFVEGNEAHIKQIRADLEKIENAEKGGKR